MRKKLFLTICLGLGLWTAGTLPVQACSEYVCEEKKDDEEAYLSCIRDKKACLEGKLKEVSAQKSTLSSAIKVFTSKIAIQEVTITQTIADIAKLEREIDLLGQRIETLDFSLDQLTGMLLARIQHHYKQQKEQPSILVDLNRGIGGAAVNAKYIQQASGQTAQIMHLAEAQRQVYDQQKDQKQVKQEQLATKQKLLQEQKQELDSQKAAQQRLLTQTQSSEKIYQQMLAEAEKELAQIQGAAKIVVREGNAVQVKRGEVIGTMGNSGYSTGAHLHFGVYRYSVEEFKKIAINDWAWYYRNYTNPLDKLENKSVLWATKCQNDSEGNISTGSGSWLWPMDQVRITQNYGSNTCYNHYYKGNPHPAIDIVGTGNISVRAVSDGDAYFCRNCQNDGGNGVFVFHEDNYMTVYWHLK